MNQPTHLKIFIASSGELQKEREAVKDFIYDLNKSYPHLRVEPVLWETDLNAGSVEPGSPRIQDDINKVLDPCQIAIVLIYNKLGAFTQEEYERSIGQSKKVYVLFKTGFSPNTTDESEAYSKVIAFKESLVDEGKLQYLEYNDWKTLKNLLHDNLPQYLNKHPPKSTNNTPAIATAKPLNTIPTFLEELVGRKDKLKELHDSLANGKKPVVLLNGLGGIGKTSIAKVYAANFADNYKHIIWTNAQQGVIQGVLSDTELLDALEIELDPKASPEQSLKQIAQACGQLPGPNLWVIDNALKDVNTSILQVLTKPTWKVLLTSRIELRSTLPIKVDLLSIDEAIQVFINYAKDEQDLKVEGEQATIQKIIKRVGHHTLVVTLLSQIVTQAPFNGDLELLHQELEQKGIGLAEGIEVEALESSTATSGNLVTIVSQLFTLNNIDELPLLLLMFFSLLPNSDLLYEDLKEIIPLKEADFNKGLNALVKNGWLQKGKTNTFRCHQIIQEAVLQQYPIDSWGDVLEKYLWHIKSVIEIDQYKDNPGHKFKWTIYGQSMVNKLKGVKSKVLIRLSDRLANIYEYMGRYTESAALLKGIIEDAEEIYKANDPMHATLQNNLAMVLEALGDYAGAKGLLEKALDSDIAENGETHPKVAKKQSNLAHVLSALGDYVGAKGLLEKALDSDIKYYGASHPEVASIQNNLANVLCELGGYIGAKGLLEKVLDSNIKHYGASHPTVAVSQSNLATVLCDLGDNASAKGLLESTLKTHEQLYEDGHPYIAQAQSNLASVLRKLGDYVGAKGLLAKALASDIKHYGASHPTVAVRANNLATVYYGIGEKEKALGYFEKAYAIWLKSLGGEHPHTKQVLGDLERVKRELGKA